jgi:hypothetical protein
MRHLAIRLSIRTDTKLPINNRRVIIPQLAQILGVLILDDRGDSGAYLIGIHPTQRGEEALTALLETFKGDLL